MTRTRTAYRSLIALLEEIDARYLGPERGLVTETDVADGHRAVLHCLERALVSRLEADPFHPVFHRAITPTMKFGGDSPDAIYHECVVRSGCSYRIRGNMAGAVYVSFSVQCGGAGGHADAVGASIHSDDLDVASDGSFELLIGGNDERRPRNWLEMPEGALNLIVRHYFEQEDVVGADPGKRIPLEIRTVARYPAPPEPSDAAIAAGIERAAAFLASRTLGELGAGPRSIPSWVSTVPNRFNQPEKPGAMAYAAVDAAYAMAPYHVAPDQALVMSGRFPACRYAGVVLWSRSRQSFEYLHRRVSFNRAQTRLEPDGSYRMVIAHRDPGVANWLDAGGRTQGTIYWRFLLPEGPVPAPRTELVALQSLAG